MDIHLPAEIAHYEGELRYFFDSMVRKLHANRHKGFAEDVPIEAIGKLIVSEMEELGQALLDEGQFAAYMETVDVANMAFIGGLVISRLTREEFDGQRNQLRADAPGNAQNGSSISRT